MNEMESFVFHAILGFTVVTLNMTGFHQLLIGAGIWGDPFTSFAQYIHSYAKREIQLFEDCSAK